MLREGNKSQKVTYCVISFKCPEDTDLQTEADSWLAGSWGVMCGHRPNWGDGLKFSYSDGFASCVCTIHLKSHIQMGGPHAMIISISTILFFKNKTVALVSCLSPLAQVCFLLTVT